MFLLIYFFACSTLIRYDYVPVMSNCILWYARLCLEVSLSVVAEFVTDGINDMSKGFNKECFKKLSP